MLKQTGSSKKLDYQSEVKQPVTPISKKAGPPAPLMLDTITTLSSSRGPESPRSPIRSPVRKKKSTLKKIISATKSATLTRTRSTRSSHSEVSAPSEKGEPEVIHVDHFIDMLDFYEKVAGRTLDNQSFTPKKVEVIPEDTVTIDEDDVSDI
jgi:hypothetical protein